MGAYLFDGVDDSLSLAAALATAAPFTVGVWFRSGDITARQVLLAIGVSGATNNRFLLSAAGADAGDPIQAETRTTSAAVASTTTGYSADTWHSAYGVFASASDRRAFIDGGSKGTEVSSRIPAGINATRAGASLTGSTPLNGRIGYVFVWNVALTDLEVADFHAGNKPQEANIIAAYDLTRDHGAGPVTDEVGTSDLTINGATYDAALSPPVTYFGGGQTHEGAASVSGAGSVAGSAIRATSTAGEVAGSGTVSATATRTTSTAGAVSGTGAVSATAHKVLTVDAALSGTGGVAAAATRSALGAVSVAGAGSVSAGIQRTAVCTASVAGTGVVSTAATRTATAVGSIVGVGSITATALGGQRGWTYDSDVAASYDATVAHTYASEEDWTYEPVTG